MSPPEIYTPLRQNEVRILTLLPKSFSSQIHGHLDIYSLDQIPPYTAISYTWGDPSILEEISINDLPLKITRNLASALRNFQHPIDKLLIWADAICTNQEDLLERGHQVALMRRVFSQATETWIWLGKRGENSDKAIDLLEDLSDVYGDFRAHPLSKSRRVNDVNWGPWAPPSWNKKDELIALEYLLARDWWFRIWIIQEVAVSRKPSLFCGSRKFSWRSMINGCRMIYPHMEDIIEIVTTRPSSSPPPSREIEHSIARAISIHKEVRAYRRCHSEQLRPHSLLTLLSRHRDAIATDPRDKFIGLLGLVPNRYLTFSTKELYQIPPGNIFNMAAVLMATNELTGPLNFLDYAGYDKRIELPSLVASWVPNWDLNSRDGFLHYDIHYTPLKKSLHNRACGNYPSSYAPVLGTANDNNVLVAMGIVLDRIELVSFDQGDPLDWSRPEIAPQGNIHESSNAMEESFWMTLVAGHERPGGKPIPLIDRHLLSTVFYNAEHIFGSNLGDLELLTWYYNNKHIKFCGTSFEKLVEEVGNNHPPNACDREVMETIKNTIRDTIYDRKLAITRNGYFCLARDTMQPGDLLAILFGCEAPVILRQRGSEFQFIGTCFSHGIMEGQATTELAGQERNIQKFKIR